ncbi:FecR family protein [Pedobacter frigidisoli]|uniref:FecR family protein n=1 Tax=Pedobacter frigidisoli TaxID=2530455 RepID=A0A4R0P422_9SPHI|nr:FecR family protein [Pedobacter frigidisoli]TCD11604.1 FecR family protein [Pedobacter frigidisoli]
MEKKISYLLNQFEKGTISESEKEELGFFVNSDPVSVANVIQELIIKEEGSSNFRMEDKWETVLSDILSSDRPRLKGNLKLFFIIRWTAAAVILIAVSSTFYSKINRNKRHVFATDFSPGSNKAILTLANGSKISLTDAANGNIANQEGVTISKTASGQLVYGISNVNEKGNQNKTNTISTPNGGEWQLRLPDGTMVWLNAASSLTYPSTFAGSKHRRVELNGEAYFEVSKDKLHPFIVHTVKQDVEVLGTYFNINSYSDEDLTKTTLMEGRVRVTKNDNQKSQMLSPGMQSTISEKEITVRTVDVEESIAWKKGYFMFINERQESILRKISRWYDVKIEYADEAAKDVVYYGTVSRFDKISKILEKFEHTGEVRFEIKGRKIIVYKK